MRKLKRFWLLLGVIATATALCLSGCASAEKKEPPKKYKLYAVQITSLFVACFLLIDSLPGCVHLDTRTEENPISEKDKDTLYMGVEIPMGEAKKP